MAFKEDFPETVALLRRGPSPQIQHFLPHDLTGGGLPAMHPAAFLDFLGWILSGLSRIAEDAERLRKILRMLPREKSLLPAWQRVCDAFSRAGASGGPELLKEGGQWFTE